MQPYDMCERVYLVVKSILNRGGKHEDYVLKDRDIIKLGRAKFLVRDINIVAKHEKAVLKNKRIKRHREGYEMRNKLRPISHVDASARSNTPDNYKSRLSNQ